MKTKKRSGYRTHQPQREHRKDLYIRERTAWAEISYNLGASIVEQLDMAILKSIMSSSLDAGPVQSFKFDPIPSDYAPPGIFSNLLYKYDGVKRPSKNKKDET